MSVSTEVSYQIGSHWKEMSHWRDNWGMFYKGRIHKTCEQGIGKPQGGMRHPRTRNNKAPIDFPRPERARKETSYQNQRVQAVGGEKCLTKAVVFVEGSRQPKETQRENPGKQYPHLTLLPSSCFFWYCQLTSVTRKPEGTLRSTLIQSIQLGLLGCTRGQRTYLTESGGTKWNVLYWHQHDRYQSECESHPSLTHSSHVQNPQKKWFKLVPWHWMPHLNKDIKKGQSVQR